MFWGGIVDILELPGRRKGGKTTEKIHVVKENAEGWCDRGGTGWDAERRKRWWWNKKKKRTNKSCKCEVFGGKSIAEWLQKTTNRSSFQLSAPSLRFNSSLGKMYSPVQFPNDFCLSLIMAQCHIVSILFTTTVYNIIQKYLIFCIKDTKSKNSAIKIDDARLWHTAGQSINITNTSNDNKHPCMSLKATWCQERKQSSC